MTRYSPHQLVAGLIVAGGALLLSSLPTWSQDPVLPGTQQEYDRMMEQADNPPPRRGGPPNQAPNVDPAAPANAGLFYEQMLARAEAELAAEAAALEEVALRSRRNQAIRKLDNEVRDLVRKYSAATDATIREGITNDLAGKVEQQFTVKQEEREKEIVELEAQVKKLRDLQNQRQAQKDRIVNDRVSQLLNDALGLGWGSSGVPNALPRDRNDDPFGTSTFNHPIDAIQYPEVNPPYNRPEANPLSPNPRTYEPMPRDPSVIPEPVREVPVQPQPARNVVPNPLPGPN